MCVKYEENQAYCYSLFLCEGEVQVDIEHSPTEAMVADYFTKPLQGGLFQWLQDQIMGLDMSSPYHSSHRSVLIQQQN